MSLFLFKKIVFPGPFQKASIKYLCINMDFRLASHIFFFFIFVIFMILLLCVLFMYLGQFWNMPVDISPYNETTPDGADLYIVNITVGGTHRNCIVEFRNATWDDANACLYVGNCQAGPNDQVYSINDAVIAGNYKDYLIKKAYSEINFAFGLFREDLCNIGSGY